MKARPARVARERRNANYFFSLSFPSHATRFRLCSPKTRKKSRHEKSYAVVTQFFLVSANVCCGGATARRGNSTSTYEVLGMCRVWVLYKLIPTYWFENKLRVHTEMKARPAQVARKRRNANNFFRSPPLARHSRAPRFRLCSPKIRKKLHLFCRL